MSRVAVVGGGLAGLVAARDLVEQGHHVCLFEAGPGFGGAIAAAPLAGHLIDIGAEGFAITRSEATSLVEALGLGDCIVAPQRADAHIWRAGQLLAMPRSLMGIPTELDSDQIRALVGDEAIRRAHTLDAGAWLGSDDNITLADLVSSRLGPEFVTHLLNPVVCGVHATDPDRLQASAVIPGILAAAQQHGSLTAAADAIRSRAGTAGSAIHGLQGGMTSLIAALVAELAGTSSVQLHNDAHVTGITRRRSSWQVQVDVAHEVDAVVLAVSAPAAAKLLHDQPELQRVLSAFAVGDVAVVSMVLPSTELDQAPVGSGVLVDAAASSHLVSAKAMTHATAKWAWLQAAFGPGRHLLRLSYGRNGVIEHDLEHLLEIAVADARALTGADLGDPIAAKVTRWRESLVQATPGHLERVREVDDLAAELSGFAVVGAGLGGNGIAGTIARAQRASALL